MMDPHDTLAQLTALSRDLGDPALDYVILGEGNTSADAGDGTFWIKASGTTLATAEPAGFVRVRTHVILGAIDSSGNPSDEEVARTLRSAIVQGPPGAMPSVETFMHAVCLGLDGVRYIGHTHPTAVNMLMCSRAFAEVAAGRIFPDEVVLCGTETLIVPYVDPGLRLGRELRDRVHTYTDRLGGYPKTILLQNHGLVVLGTEPRQVLDTTAMAVKAARIRVGAGSLGGIQPMDEADVRRIDTRMDEHHRRRILGVR